MVFAGRGLSRQNSSSLASWEIPHQTQLLAAALAAAASARRTYSANAAVEVAPEVATVINPNPEPFMGLFQRI
jgi:hypothetical protein